MALPYRWHWRLERWKSLFRGWFGGNRAPRPQICPVCGALVGVNARRCHECGSSLHFSFAALNKKLGGLIGGDAPVTTVLLVANILLFAVTLLITMEASRGSTFRALWGVSNEAAYRLGLLLPWPLMKYLGEWWRLVTAMFLHGSVIHIGFNMMVLYQIGPAVEELYGSARYLFIYLVTGVAGFVVSSYIGGHPSLGASGALLGLIGILLAVTSRRGGAYMRQLRSQLISSLVILFALGLLPGVGVDNWAHGGGLVAGFLLGRVMADRAPITPSEKRIAAGLGWLSGAAIFACFALMIVHFHDPLP